MIFGAWPHYPLYKSQQVYWFNQFWQHLIHTFRMHCLSRTRFVRSLMRWFVRSFVCHSWILLLNHQLVTRQSYVVWYFSILCCILPSMTYIKIVFGTLLFRHNEPDGVSNHQPHDCLLNRYSGTDQIKYRRSSSMAFVREEHRWPVNSPHRWPLTRKFVSFDDVIIINIFLWDSLQDANKKA